MKLVMTMSETMTQTPNKESGMTLIELTIATVILATMLATMTQFFISLVHQNRGAVSVQDSTQNVRYALDDISAQARLANAVYVAPNPNTPGPPAFNQICLYEGGNMVEYYAVTPAAGSTLHQILYKHIFPSVNVTQSSIPTNCPTISQVNDPTLGGVGYDVPVISDSNASSGATNGINVADLRASASPFTPMAGHVQTLTVRLGLTSNLTDVIPGTDKCIAGTEEFCSVTSFETTVSLREAQSVGP